MDCDENEENKKLRFNCDKENERKKFQCGVCAQVFTQKNNYNRHVLSHSTFHTCQFCGDKFRRKDYVVKHISKKHQHGGRVKDTKTKDLPSTQSNIHNPSFSNDHDYTKSASQPNSPSAQHNPSSTMDVSNEHNYTKSSSPERTSTMTGDHTYSRSSERSAETQPPDPRPPSLPTENVQHAINNSIQDFTISPNNHEQYDY